MSAHPESSGAVQDVWLVEDHRAFRQLLIEVVTSDPALTCSLAVHRCEEVLVALKRGQRPALVLLDLGLPDLDGVEGLRRMRQLAPELSVLVVTIEADDQRVFDALEAGACGYLLKPATPAQLLEGMHAVLAGGSPISPAIARKVLRVFHAPRRVTADHGLTAREAEILELLVAARTVSQIATMLGLSRHTVDSHVRRIYEKLHVHSRAGAVAAAITRSRDGGSSPDIVG